jgi:hypothetical protein
MEVESALGNFQFFYTNSILYIHFEIIHSIFELSARSVAAGGAPVEVPDFTRGRWRTNPPLALVTL